MKKSVDIQKMDGKLIRKTYWKNLLINWCALPRTGKGVVLFKKCFNINKKVNYLEGLTDSEFSKNNFRIVGDVPPVREFKGRS